jgi:hypothetical protein
MANDNPQLDNDKLVLFIIDGEVVTAMKTSERLAAVFTSNPIVVEHDEAVHGPNPRVGDLWVDGKLKKRD